MTSPETTACPLCGGEGWREVFRFLRPRPADPTGRPTEALYGRAGRLVRCTGCGLVRQDPPVEAPYEEAADADYLSEEEGIRHTFSRALDRIEAERPRRGRLLDVGCGPGLLLDEARRRGWDTIGVEPSAWAAQQAKGRGLDVRQGTLESAELTSASFGAIVASDVIEHVPDPVAFIRELRRVLEPGGVLFLTTPDVESLPAKVLRRWWWSVLPGHLYYFSPRTLRQLLETNGFEVREISTHPKAFSLAYYASRLAGYTGLAGRAAVALVRLVADPRRLVSPDFRDRISALAEPSCKATHDG